MTHQANDKPETADRPLITFALFAYNQEDYIDEAIDGAFSQTHTPLEIILSDDCSEDMTFQIIKNRAKKYQGPHRLVLNRNERNLGIGGHFNKVMSLASGEIVLLAAGDDISLPNRAYDSWKILNANPELTGVSLSLKKIANERSKSRGMTNRVPAGLAKYTLDNFCTESNFHLNAPGRAIRKYTHDYFGPLIDSCPVEDRPSLLRCMLHGPVAESEKIGVLYRLHGENYYASDNKFSIDYEAIFANCVTDVNTAYENGLIGGRLSKKCLAAISTRSKKEKAKIAFHYSNYKLLTFFTKILFATGFSGRAKLMYLRKALFSSS